MKKNTEKNEKSEKKLNFVKIGGKECFAVANVNNYSDSCTFFNLYIKSAVGNVAIYGCKVVSNEEHGDFIAFPSRKYEYKYYDHCSIIFDEGMSDAIIEEVSKSI